jgi:hypothetical protein
LDRLSADGRLQTLHGLISGKKPKLKVSFFTAYNADIAGKDIYPHETQKFLLKPHTVEKLSHFVREALDQTTPE